jgi:hypothetical protein
MGRETGFFKQKGGEGTRSYQWLVAFGKKKGTANCAQKFASTCADEAQEEEPITFRWVATSRLSDSENASHNGHIGSFHMSLLSNTAGANFYVNYTIYSIGCIAGKLERVPGRRGRFPQPTVSEKVDDRYFLISAARFFSIASTTAEICSSTCSLRSVPEVER